VFMLVREGRREKWTERGMERERDKGKERAAPA
jgi:hypothetical protein